MGLKSHGNKFPWGQISMGPKSRGSKVQWGQISMGQIIIVANSNGAKVPFSQSPMGTNFQWGQIPMGPKSRGSKVQWGKISMGQNSTGTKFHWGKIIMGPNSHGAKVTWWQSPMVPKSHGPKVPWSQSHIVPKPHIPEAPRSQRPMVSKPHCPEAPWSQSPHGPKDPWSQRPMVPKGPWRPEGTLGAHMEPTRAKWVCSFVNLWFIELHAQLKNGDLSFVRHSFVIYYCILFVVFSTPISYLEIYMTFTFTKVKKHQIKTWPKCIHFYFDIHHTSSKGDPNKYNWHALLVTAIANISSSIYREDIIWIINRLTINMIHFDKITILNLTVFTRFLTLILRWLLLRYWQQIYINIHSYALDI